MKILMVPHLAHLQGESGLDCVVRSYFKHLPSFGIELVDPGATSYDLKAVHAGATGADCTVHHNHGLYWTADYDASPMEYETNANIVLALRGAREVTVPSRWVAENIARDMRFSPHIVPHGIEWEAWQHHEPCGHYILWNKNRTSDVCDPQPMADLARMFGNLSFVTTFAPPNTEVLPNIHVTGVRPHEEMKRIIQQAGVYLATTKETFGIGILEAMAAGIPTLAYDCGGASELLEHLITGYLATPGDLEDLANGLEYCIRRREKLGKAAQEVAKRYTWEAACEKIAGVYDAALHPDPPTVCIVIPSYNYANKVSYAIQSASSQTYPHLTHIVVVDDGSPDGGATREVVERFTSIDSRVHYLRQPNMGVAYARNNGAKECNTKYICCLDADDALAPEFLSTCVEALESDPTLGIAYTSLYLVYPNGVTALGEWPGDFDYQRQLRGHNQVPTCCVFRRRMFDRLGGYRQRYSPQGAGAEDAEFWLRAGAYGFPGARVSNNPLFIYSFLTGRVSGDPTYRELNWRAWHPWVRGGQHPFASLARPPEGRASHPVRQYDQPLISVIIPVGPGHERVLIDALDSLEAQTFRRWEAIVIDDTGGHLDITAYPHVQLLQTDGRKGAGYARNRGIEIARAPAFVCLDADDFLQPEFLHYVYDAWQQDADTWVYTDMYVLKANGELEHYLTQEFDESGVQRLWRRGLASVTCLYPKAAWEVVGGYDEESTREDWDFHLRLAARGYCGRRVSLPLFTYRHGTGKRRDEGSIRKEAEILHDKYPQEAIVMGCRNCPGVGRSKRRSRDVPVPKVDQPQPAAVSTSAPGLPPADWVLIEFIGGNSNDLTFRGGGGRIYRFGNNPYHRVKAVHPDDVARFLGHVYFRRASGAAVADHLGSVLGSVLAASPTSPPAETLAATSTETPADAPADTPASTSTYVPVDTPAGTPLVATISEPEHTHTPPSAADKERKATKKAAEKRRVAVAKRAQKKALLDKNKGKASLQVAEQPPAPIHHPSVEKAALPLVARNAVANIDISSLAVRELRELDLPVTAWEELLKLERAGRGRASALAYIRQAIRHGQKAAAAAKRSELVEA